ncbi:hypothetical protein [Bowmanella sp. JS7-9]|uniref:Uncharacterized protein n=1 Tax=Pseudobowmanella zhangzhouensis TaxID=1537679 RepID=A0ABW1XPF6_9ALTE|nr:hypothetical protein [Bowmanella sp. JS7-9]TBX20567.1 hypothetical protein TK45_14730 [Bowmanella sp. JS7-9]
MNKQSFDQQLQQQIDALPKDVRPERDLWQAIERGIDTHVAPKKRPYGIAAAIALFGLVGTLVVVQQRDDAQQSLLAQLSSQHKQQVDSLLVKYAEQPALTDNWQAQLQQLDDAASAIKKALKEDPDNMALLKMLTQVHQQQIDLIEKVHAPQWQQI